MSQTDLSLSEAKKYRTQLLDKINQADAEYNTLLETDPIGAAKKFQEVRFMLQGVGEFDSQINLLKDRAKAKLADGSFLTEDIQTIGGSLPTTSDGITAKISSFLTSIDDQQYDLTTGLDAKTRGDIAFTRDQEKDARLAELFGSENVKTEKILGAPVRFVRNQSGTWVAVDEFGFSPKDIIDASGQAAPIAGSIGGAFVGTLIQRSPIGTSTGSASGYGLLASVQDGIYNAVTGSGPGLLDAIPERMTEGAAGMAFEYPFLKVTAPIGMSLAKGRKGKITKRQSNIEKYENYLKTQGYDVSLARIAAGGSAKTEKRLQTAQKLPNWMIGRDVLDSAKRLERIKDDSLSFVQKGDAMYGDTLKVLQEERQALEGILSQYNREMAQSVRVQVDDELRNFMRAPKQDKEEAGAYLFSQLRGTKEAANKIKNETYNPHWERADSMGISVDPIKVAERIEKQYFSRIFRNPKLQAEIDQLRKRPENAKRIETINNILQREGLAEKTITRLNLEKQNLEQLSGPLTLRQLDDLVKQFQEAFPESGLVGAPTKQQTAGRAAQTIKGFRDEILAENNLLDSWNNATSVYRQRLGFEEQQLGALLKETLGRSDLTGSQIVSKIISDPRIAEDVLNATALLDPANAQKVAYSLQRSYFDQIGLTGRKTGDLNQFNFDSDVVKRLFAFDKKGNPNLIYGERMVKKLEQLRGAINKADVDYSKISRNELFELESVLTENSINELTGKIIGRLKVQKEIDLFKNNALLDAASLGHREAIERAAFPEALWSAPPEKVRKILGKFGTKDQEMMRGDYIEYFFAKYPPKSDSAWGDVVLWDGDQFLKDAAKKPAIIANLRAATSDKFVDDIIAASNVMQTIRNVPVPLESNIATGAVNQTGAKIFAPFRTIMHAGKHRIAGAAYRLQRSKLFEKYLGNIGKKDLSPEQYETEMNKLLLGMFSASQGVEALLKTGRYDPGWASNIGQILGTVPKETLEYREKFGTEREPDLEEAIK
jgi:hypothetical protein